MAELDSFVGREADLTALADRFGEGNRLVTVVGPAGVGKTRLAGRFLCERWSTEVAGWFCDVREACDADALCGCVAQSLGLQQQDDSREVSEQVGDALAAHSEAWLVLDNFEQLVDTSSLLLSDWLRQAPGLRVLVTSRRVLRLVGEQVCELEGLRLPVEGSDWGSEAMQLFYDRARAVDPGFRRSEATAKVVAELVRRLEGVPLALELAAGQLRRESVNELLSRLEHSLELTSDCRDADPRHASLRAAIDSSWELLSLHEREAVLQLTVFRGGFTIDAAEAVLELTEAGRAQDESCVPAVLASLREASVIRLVTGCREHHSGAPVRRFELYRSLYEYAEERRGNLQPACRRHAEFFSRRGEYWVAQLVGDEARAARAWLLNEQSNLESAFHAMRGLDTQGDGPSVEVASIALVIHSALRDQMPSRSLRYLDRALGSIDVVPYAEKTDLSTLRARLLLSRAEVRRLLAQYGLAHADLDEASGLIAANQKLEVMVQCERGTVFLKQGMPKKALQAFQHALTLISTLDCPGLEGRVHHGLGYVYNEAFRDPRSFEHLDRAQSLLGGAGYVEAAARARALWLASTALFQRTLPIAAVHEEAEAAARRKDRWCEAHARLSLAWFLLDEGKPEASRALFDQVRELTALSGLRRTWSSATFSLGMALDVQDDVQAAVSRYEAALDVSDSIGDLRNHGVCRAFLGGIHARLGNVEQAEREIDCASRLFDGADDPSWGLIAEVQRGQVDLRRCRDALAGGNVRDAVELRDSAQNRMWNAHQSRADDAASGVLPSLARCCIIVRVALRLLERELNRLPLPELRVWHDGSAFQVGEGSRVELPRGQIMRRVLGALAKARKTSMRAIDTHTLFEQGWPSQRLRPATVSLRVRVMVSKLRKLGLDGILLTNDEGYYLDPLLPFTVVDDSPDAGGSSGLTGGQRVSR